MAKGRTEGHIRPIDSSVMETDIRSDVEKHKSRLRFALLTIVTLSFAYVLREAVVAPPGPQRKSNSVQCLEAGGMWRPESRDADGHFVEAYCGRTAPCQQAPGQTDP